MFNQGDIKEHMEVLGSDGHHIGIVDHMEGSNQIKLAKKDPKAGGSDGHHIGIVDHMEGSNQIKLAKKDPKAGGKHHFIPTDWVDHIDKHVHLNKSSQDVHAQWKDAA